MKINPVEAARQKREDEIVHAMKTQTSKTLKDIAEEFGVSVTCLYIYSKKHGIKRQRGVKPSSGTK